MLEDDALLLLPTEEDLPDSDGKPVDNELQLLAPNLLRAILADLWEERLDWFFAVNLGLYHTPGEAAIGPDAFLCLGAERVRQNSKLRLSYLVYREGAMPQWVLEVVSQTPGAEYTQKFDKYAELGVLYYTIYNPSHSRRDRHEPFEVYRLEAGQYVRQPGNPVWMPELGLGIGHERGTHDRVERDWLYWYDEQGQRYPVPADALRQERLERQQEQLMRMQVEERLTEEARSRLAAEQALTEEARSRLAAEQALEQERQQRQEDARLAQQAQRQQTRTVIVNLLGQGLSRGAIAQALGLSLEQVEVLRLGDDTSAEAGSRGGAIHLRAEGIIPGDLSRSGPGGNGPQQRQPGQSLA
jgi:Uma2 family endonuclease